MSLSNILRPDIQTIAIICNQWGDSGKGKYSDYFGSIWADVIARGTGGNNAGHTVWINGMQWITHLLPTGIRYDNLGKFTIMGKGMVVNLSVLCDDELSYLDAQGMSYNNLMLSKDASVIMPYHIFRDKGNVSQKKGGIGSTGRGIGPCYADRKARKVVQVQDLFNNNFSKFDPDRLAGQIEKSIFFNADTFSVEEMIEGIRPYAERIKPFVRNTDKEMMSFVKEGKKILLEGAQGLLLSDEFGTYPYVTSSDCSLEGTARGAGFKSKDAIDLPLCIVKYPFMTRVGAGPFPTEIGGLESEKYCAEGLVHDIFYEVKEYLGMNIDLGPIRELQKEKNTQKLDEVERFVNDYIRSSSSKIQELMNSDNPEKQAAGMRLAAGEYGATTKRPRRLGWTDAVAAKYAVEINGPNMILTKADCLAGAKEFKIGYGYFHNSVPQDLIQDFDKDANFLYGTSPYLESYEGYGDISEITTYAALPDSLKESIGDFEKFTGGNVMIISNGADQQKNILKD